MTQRYDIELHLIQDRFVLVPGVPEENAKEMLVGIQTAINKSISWTLVTLPKNITSVVNGRHIIDVKISPSQQREGQEQIHQEQTHEEAP